jgi:hypothetical protein
MDTKRLIELVKIHSYEECDEFSTPLMNEVIKKLEKYNEIEPWLKMIWNRLESL